MGAGPKASAQSLSVHFESLLQHVAKTSSHVKIDVSWPLFFVSLLASSLVRLSRRWLPLARDWAQRPLLEESERRLDRPHLSSNMQGYQLRSQLLLWLCAQVGDQQIPC